ncbi:MULTISPECIES: class I SAM-dependent methyltransferase [Calothrix]|uniref:Class I SAM-dependent methyltransferase n=2 Tax=Calothrix TaxID=1186 RepID=A0ABR8AML1_9CYAN|nr:MULTISPECIES: class I SAM-dependent methyltransferase [Calothrix]MBD2200470.1 class I SAM-dependent methyltransferase [Calothrix parietina FACHB-288]MBD2229474.1 class I SAM-dependent methyltransferase [Calothrix anomala FACHB-343]
MTTISTYDPTLFEGAAWYYARYRPQYPPVLFDLLTDKFKLNGQGRLLDLGCGAGLIAIPLHNKFREIFGLDPDADMLQEAKIQALELGANNISWIQDRAENLSQDFGKFQLVTIGRAFHWMQRELLIEHIYNLLANDGGLAIIKTYEDPWNSDHPWKKTAIAVVQSWLGEKRRTGESGQGFWKPLAVSHEEIIAKSSFNRQENFEVKYEKSWTIDSYIGYLYSTAFCLPSFFGSAENRQKFEAELKQSLLAVEPTGTFTEELPITVIAAWKN